MTEFDPHPGYQDYAQPGRLVSAQWLSARLGTPGLRVIEVDEDTLLYDIGHIPTATRIRVEEDLQDPLTRDIVDGTGFAALMSNLGIRREDTVVFYGDKNNWWAAYALWVFELFGHPDVRLLDGGRDAWMTEERDTSFMVPTFSPSQYPAVERDDHTHRVFVSELHGSSVTVIDVRSPAEYAGQPTEHSAKGDSRYGTTIRHGHIPGATNLEWDRTVYPNGAFRSAAELQVAYGEVPTSEPVVLYSHLGAQSAHTWFVLKYLLGVGNLRNYDGSWAEWGNMVRMPIER